MGDMADLTLGNSPDRLVVNLVSGDPVDFSLTLKQDGVEIPWPEAPVLEFESGTSWTASLTNSDATATWNATDTVVDAVLALAEKKVRLSVGGLTWWAGVWVKRA